MKLSIDLSLCRYIAATTDSPVPADRFLLSSGSAFRLSDGSFFVLQGF